MSTLNQETLSCQRFSVGGAVVHPKLNEIHVDGRIVRVERQVMLLLVHLACHVDQVVTRDALFEALWEGSCAGDEALTQAISKLRKALVSSGPGPIQTIRKVGYKLNGPVCLVDQASQPSASSIQPTPKRRKWLYSAAAVLAVLMLGRSHIRVYTDDGAPHNMHMVRLTIPDDGKIKLERAVVEVPGPDSLIDFKPVFGSLGD